MSDPVMELTGVSKRFGATQALADVSLTLYPGETHALLGENGAGKSTLLKVMTGIHTPDTGVMRVNGEETAFKGSGDAQKAGVAAIYQEPAIFPDLNVAENIFMSHQDRGGLVRWQRMYKDAEAILARIDVRMDVRTLASTLTVASQQAVEIAKALSLDVRVLIMDEPTAALSAHEVAELFTQIRRLTDAGERILGLRPRPTAVICANDLVALGVLQVMIRHGVRVPDDMAIVGFDDIEFASAATIPLTSVRIPRYEIGRIATELLLEEADRDPDHVHQRVVLEPELVVRESTIGKTG